MDLFLTKLLTIFIFPLGASILAFFIVLFLLATGFRRLAWATLLFVVCGLWAASTPAVANWLIAGLERRYPPIAIDALPEADVAIVLGGIVSQPLPPRVTPDYSDSIDRVFQTARLFRAGKVRHIVVSAGNLPWQRLVKPESSLIADALIELGVAPEAIVQESASRDTFENAINTAEILKAQGWRSALLVTSAAHMPRAVATFKSIGIDVIPASTDVKSQAVVFSTALDLLPDARALATTSDAIKELFGLIAYRAKGWA